MAGVRSGFRAIAGAVAIGIAKASRHLLAYRGSSYGYDGENRLAAVALLNGTVTTSYDAAGRLRQPGHEEHGRHCAAAEDHQREPGQSARASDASAGLPPIALRPI